MPTEKDANTQSIRDAIRAHAANAIETDRADPSMIDLSFESSVNPVRSVWIAVCPPALPLDIVYIDFENTEFDGPIDHTIVRLSFAPTAQPTMANAVELWFSGAAWEDFAASPFVMNVSFPNGKP